MDECFFTVDGRILTDADREKYAYRNDLAEYYDGLVRH